MFARKGKATQHRRGSPDVWKLATSLAITDSLSMSIAAEKVAEVLALPEQDRDVQAPPLLDVVFAEHATAAEMRQLLDDRTGARGRNVADRHAQARARFERPGLEPAAIRPVVVLDVHSLRREPPDRGSRA